MLPTILFNESKRDLALEKASHTVLTQQILFAGGRFEIHCEFIAWSFSDFVTPQRYFHPSPPVSRLILIERGRIELDMLKRHHTLQSGKIYLLPANQPFHAEYLDHCVTKGFHLHIYDALHFPVITSLAVPIELDLPELFLLLGKMINQQKRALIEGLVMSAIVACIEPLFPVLYDRHTASPQFRQVLSAFSSRPPARIRLEELAKELQISSAALSKGFVRRFKVTFKEYQQMQILSQARMLLTTTDDSINQIAHELGFDDPNYFHAFFKRMTQITPMQYRHNNNL